MTTASYRTDNFQPMTNNVIYQLHNMIHTHFLITCYKLGGYSDKTLRELFLFKYHYLKSIK